MGERPPSRRRRALRWVLRIVLGIVALAVVLVAIAIGALHTDWGRNKIREQIVAELQADFPGSTIAALEGSPFGTLVLRGVTLNARDHRPLVTIERLTVDAALRPLLGKTVRVEAVRVAGVEVFVRELPPEPPAAVPATPSAPSEPSAWTIEAADIALDRLRVTVETADGSEVFEAIAVRAGVWLPAGEPLAASVIANGTWRGETIAASATVRQRGDVIDVPLATISLGEARAAAYAMSFTDVPAVEGLVAAVVPASLAKRLADVELPGDAVLTAAARMTGDVTFAGQVGSARVDGAVRADLVAERARGVITADVPDLAAISDGAAVGSGIAVLAVDATAERVRGLASLTATIDGAPPGTALVALDATLTAVDLVAGARAGRLPALLGGATATATARLDASAGGDAWTLTDARVVGQARDVEQARGTVEARIAAHGPLWPARDLDVTGTLATRRLRREQVRVGKAVVDIDARIDDAGTRGSARVTVADIRSGETRVPSAAIAADVTVDRDGAIDVALGPHRVRTADGAVWSGRGGRVGVTAQAITVEGVRTKTGTSTVVASARVDRQTEDIRATVSARDVALSIADPTLRGSADADLTAHRTRGRWQGNGTVTARGVAAPGQPAVDGTASVALAGRKLTLDGTVDSAELGRASLALAVHGPRDPTDVDAWQRLPRTALEELRVSIDRLDTRPLGGTGTVEGEIVIGASDVRGELHVRDVETAQGAVAGDLVLAPAAGGGVAAHATGRLADLPAIVADATLSLPARPFSPEAWQALGRHALRDAKVTATGIALDPALLARFDVDAPYSATTDVTLVAGPAAEMATLTVDVRALRGGDLVAPIDAHLEATTTTTGTTATGSVKSRGVRATFDGTSSLTIDRVLADAIETQTVAGTLTLPMVTARELLGLFGQTEVLGGVVGGTLTVGGTIAKPTLHAQLLAERLAMASTLSGNRPPVLDRLEVDARWLGDHAVLEVLGREEGNRLLKITARGRRDLKSVVASLEAANFEIAPLAAFAPGNLRGARGTLNAAVTIRGLDPETGDVRGKLMIRDGRLPLSPELGTLRRASVDIDVVRQDIIATFDGRLGAGGGSIGGKLTAKLEGGMPMRAKLDAKVRKLQPIGELQPQIDADVTGTFVNERSRWTGELVVSKGKVLVPEETGNELLGTGAPADIVFVDEQAIVKKGRRPPTKPWLVTKIAIGRTSVEVDQPDVRVNLFATGSLLLELGDGMSLNGAITTERGSVDVLGRRYRLEQGIIDFDGTTDPRLDIRLVHDFKNLTLTVDVRGRASNPDPRLSGDPGTYTQGQLMSFFAGAEPGNDDSAAQANQAAVGASLNILSSRIGRRLVKHLPVKVDTNYEAGTASSSRAVRFGVRLSERSYLVWRQRLEARPDENPGEMVFEYQLHPNALFETTVGERASGGDLLLRTRW